jgi:hypothetical protein
MLSFYTKVAGVTFNNTGENTENRQRIIRDLNNKGLLNPGQPLQLSLDPNNPYDQNAVRVIGPDNRQLGFLPKDIAKTVSPAMRSGKQYSACVSAVTGGDIDCAYGINIRITERSTKEAHSQTTHSADDDAPERSSHDADLNMQLGFSSLLLDKWLRSGSRIWNAKKDAPYPSLIEIDGTVWTGEDLSNLCISSKRNGLYSNSIGGYMHLFHAAINESGKIPVFLVRGFFKTLIAANAFWSAFSLASAVYADLQEADIDDVDLSEHFAFSTYWEELFNLSIDVIDNGAYASIERYCAKYSDNPNYCLVRSQQDIYEDISRIRETIRDVYDR